jgi:uncharacterized protein (DUF4213/DUF364 family)
MSVLAELSQLLVPLSDEFPVPPIARVCVPPHRPAPDKGSEFIALELADGSVGLAYALPHGALDRIRADGLSDIPGRDPTMLLGRSDAGDPIGRVLRLASANAVSQWLFRLAGFSLDFVTDSLAELAFSPGDRAGMVGYFPPLVRHLRRQGIDLTVLELKQALMQRAERFRVVSDPSALAGCNKVLCTSTVLLDDSLRQALAYCTGATVAVIGPGAGMVPDPLFARGVAIVGGIRILRPIRFNRLCRRGESWGESGRKYCIRASAYPGFPALLGAARSRDGAN